MGVLNRIPAMIWAAGKKEFSFISEEITIPKTELQDLPENRRARGRGWKWVDVFSM